MDPRRSFWVAILGYGVLSTVGFLPSARSDPASAIGAAAGVLVAASGGYALRRPDRAGGPDEWNLVTVAAVGGAVLYAAGVVVGAL